MMHGGGTPEAPVPGAAPPAGGVVVRNGTWLILGVGLASLAQLAKITQMFLPAVCWLDLTAAIVLAVVLPQAVSVTDEFSGAPIRPAPGSRARRLGTALAALGSALAAACSVWLVVDWNGALLRVFLLGPVALTTLALGLDLHAGYAPRWRSGLGTLLAAARNREVQAVAAIVVVGLYFRFGSIGYFPPVDGFASIEETQRGTGARLILEQGARPWEWPLSQYVAAAAFSVFGFTIHALRVPTTLLGCLALAPFYLLVRELAAAPAALFATALLAVARWHVQVSWYNEDVYVPLFFFVTVLYLLIRTRRQPRPLCTVILGACCGYTLYDYAGFRVTPVLALVFLASGVLHRGHRRTAWFHLVLASAVIALFAIPLMGRLAHQGPEAYVEAFRRSLANKDYYTSDAHRFLWQRVERIGAAADMFTFSDRGAFLETLNTRQAPLLDPCTSVAFVVGFGTTLLHMRRRHHAFFSLAFLFLVLASTTVVQNLDFRRLSILVPFVFVFIALFASKIDGWAAGAGRGRAVRVAFALVAVLAGAYNYVFLFHVLAVDHKVRGFHRDEYSTPAFYLQQHYRNEWVVLVTPMVENFFLPNDYDWIKPPGLQGDFALRPEAVLPIEHTPPAGRDVLLLIERPFQLEGLMAQVPAMYPGASCELRRDPDDSRWDLGVCRIPAAAVGQGKATEG
ncbi:MAG: hypothetical protein H6Q33_110 [Deltaproteobacteria bacterium]|nr:hypothetical protein [Deltaproteobacteria bacterium]